MFLFFLSHVLSFFIPITPRNRERYWKTFAALLMAWNFIPKASQPVCWLLFWLSSIQKTWHNNPWQLRFIWWTTMTDTVMFLRLGIGRSKWISYFLSFFYSPEVITLKISHYIILGCLYFFLVPGFRRAVLMSGTALAPDAIISDAGYVTRQVAAQLNCPLSDDELIVCLRNKKVQDLLNVQVNCSVMWCILRFLIMPFEDRNCLWEDEWASQVSE